MDFEEFYRHLSEYIDRRFDEELKDAFEGEDFFGGDFFEDGEEFFGEEINEMFGEMDKMIQSDVCCSSLYNTLCRTIEFCGEMDEMDVPEDTHRKLFELLGIEITEDR